MKHKEYLNSLEAKGVPVIERDERSFDEIMEEKYKRMGKSWNNLGEDVSKRALLELEGEGPDEEEEHTQVMRGVVLMVAKKLVSSSQDLHRVVMDLGGEVVWQFSHKVTHFVFQGKLNDLTKEFRVAKDAGCFIVSPNWVYMCRDEKCRVAESTFPHTFNPRLKLDKTETNLSSTSRLSRSSKSHSHKTNKLPSVEDEDGDNEPHEKTMDKTTPPPTEMSSNLIDVASDPPPTDTLKVQEEVSADLAVMENLLDDISRTPVQTNNRKGLRTVLTTQDNTKQTPPQVDSKSKKDDQDKESQVMWVDPEEEVNRKKMVDHLNSIETQELEMETMGSMNVENL